MKKSSVTYAVLRKIAACILICLSVGFATLMAIPTVRASVWDSVVNFYEKYIKFDFNVTAGGEETIGEYTLGYVPDGFEQISAHETTARNKYKYEHREYFFIVSYCASDNNSIFYDDENGKVESVRIKGKDGYCIVYLDGNTSIVWQVNKTVFSLVGNVPAEELMKIAENIS